MRLGAHRLGIRCPNCGSRSSGTRQRVLSTLVTEVAYRCSNMACSALFMVSCSVDRYLQLPITSINTSVVVPLSPMIDRRRLIDTLGHMHTATLTGDGTEIISQTAPHQLDIFQQQPHSGE